MLLAVSGVEQLALASVSLDGTGLVAREGACVDVVVVGEASRSLCVARGDV